MTSNRDTAAVKVGVRIRPLNEKEIQEDMPVSFSPDSNGEKVTGVREQDESGQVVKLWSYDHVFGPKCSNKLIFDTMGSNLVDAAIDGYNTVIFMYGQTSSGNFESQSSTDLAR